MKPYQDLTRGGQTRRLRPMALQALTYYDLEVQDLQLVTNSFNGIYKVTTRGGETCMLRVGLPIGGHSAENLRSEMAWLTALSRDTTLSVPTPYYTRTGESFVTVATPGVPEPRHCALFRWVPGTCLGDRYTPQILVRWGRMMAQLHTQAAAFQPPPDFQILSFDRIYPYNDPFVVFDAAHAGRVSPARRALYERAVAWAQNAIDRLKASGEPMRVIHGDLHSGNLCIHRGELSPIDFEDLMWGWPIQDIATTLYYLCDDPRYPEFCASFKEGYTSHSPWPERTPDEIPAFIAVRAVGMINLELQAPELGGFADFESDEFAARIEARLRRLMSL